MVNLFQDPTKSLPKSDSQIVRVSMQENEVAGRKDHMPSGGKAGTMSIAHIPNAGSKS